MRHAAKVIGIMLSLGLLPVFTGWNTAHADVIVTASNAGGLTLSYRAENISTDSLQVDGKAFLRFSCEGHTGSGSIGAPYLPARTVLFAAPSGSLPTVEVSVHSRRIMSGVTVAPRPELTDDGSGFTREVYRTDPVHYAMSGYQPSSFALLGAGHERDSVTFWELKLSPILFDAHISTATIADSLTVTVSWSGSVAGLEASSRVPGDVLNRSMVISDSPVRPKSLGRETNPFATGDWYKIAVSDSGVYSVTASELAKSGFPVGTVRVGEVRVYYGGGKVLPTTPGPVSDAAFREIAIKIRDINGDGYFGQEDSFLFYGESLSRLILSPDGKAVTFQNHPYSKTNFYWLTRSSEGTPVRMETRSQTPADTLPVRSTYREKIHIERETNLEYGESGIEWYWDSVKGTSSKAFSFNTPGGVPGDSVRIAVNFLNPTVQKGGSSIAPLHDLEIHINDIGPFRHYNPALATSRFTVTVPGALAENGNLLKIRRTTGDPVDAILLDWLEVEYNRTLKYSAGGVEFRVMGSGAPERLLLSAAPHGDLLVFDTTDPYRVVEYTGKLFDASTQTFSFRADLTDGRYTQFLVCDTGNYRKAASITRKGRTDLRNPNNSAEYLILTPKNFMGEANRLAQWRGRDSSADPLRTKVVDVEDIYDEFGWGVYDPTSIRDYLQYLHEYGQPQLKYCCFMGDTTYKFKNINASQTSKNWIPTYTRKTITTDDYFTWFDTSLRPYIAIGRLCVNTAEESKLLVNKIIDYEQNPEQGPWRNRVLLIADDTTGQDGKGDELDFTLNIEQFDRMSYIPQNMERIKIMGVEYPMVNLQKPDETEDLLEAFNDGSVLALYIGHGNKTLLAHEHILVGARDIERINNAGRQPLFFIASCSVGNFDRIDFTSLAEMLHLRNGGGCIGVVAATRETYNSSNNDLAEQFYHYLFNTDANPEHRIGFAMQQAKRSVANHDFETNFAELYILFGDPGLRLSAPRYTVATSTPTTLHQLGKTPVAGSISDNGRTVPFNGTLHITARGPIQRKQYITHRGSNLYYTMPGKVFFRGNVPIGESGFSAAFVVPKDVESGTTDSRVMLFAEGENNAASGIVDKIAVAGLDPNAPEDTAGPEILVSFDGKPFEDGDFVKRQPVLSATLSDPSGINVYGNRGHNVTVTIDNSDMFVLTDKVTAAGGYATATVDFHLPQLVPGEHTLVISAYDTYNNVTKKEVTLNVVGSDTGDVAIRELLNYPNPMRTEGTTFTFSLTDDAGSADIKVYSQSGRLVDTIRFSAGYGFNRVFWKPASEIANGVYFYKLTVRSLNGRKSTKTEKLIVMR